MRIEKLKIENFRCFQNFSVDLGYALTPLNCIARGGLTVFVAANGQGKTAILEAIKYLLGIFISRFPKTSVPRIKEFDYRKEWIVQKAFYGKPEIKEIQPPYMLLSAVASFPDEYDSTTCSCVEWDILQKRDKTEKTNNKAPHSVGGRLLHGYADAFLDCDNEGHPRSLPIIAYYNTERAVIRNKPERRRGFQKAFNRYDAYAGALDNGLNYKKTIEWLCYLEDKQRREREDVRKWEYQSLEHRTIQLAIESMLPGFSNLRTTLKPLDLIVDINDGNTSKTCRIDTQLSDGYKSVLVLVLDLVSRILEANSIIPDITPEQLLQSDGIVLIDEVDLHLHPSWQQRILGDLLRTFPNIQFIVTTHSPQVVSSVPKECVRVISDGKIVPFNTQTQGVESQDILAQIFGTNPAPQHEPYVKMLNEYAHLEAVGKADTQKAGNLREQLIAHFGEQYPPLQRIEIHRKFFADRKGGKNA